MSLLLAAIAIAALQDEEPAWADLSRARVAEPAPPPAPGPGTWTFELAYFYTKVDESDLGPWDGFRARAKHVFPEWNNNTILVDVLWQSRPDGDAQFVSSAQYINLSDRFWTFSTVGVGSGEDFVPNVLFQLEGNYKLPNAEDWVITAGGSLLDFDDERSILNVAFAVFYYIPSWVFQGRLIYSINDPGDVSSISYLLQALYTVPDTLEAGVTLTFGDSDYRPLQLGAGIVDVSFLNWRAHGRFAIDPQWWILLAIEFGDLKDLYSTLGFEIGVAHSF